jgi:eukaryotic-like serine/threonine-protein kinase
VTDPIEHLARVGMPSGPSVEEALATFAELRTTPDEGRAVHRLLARDAANPLPEPVLVAVASALVDRGEPVAAAAVLARASTTPALLLRADLCESGGDLAGAIAFVEQVLARDIDWPGARERHARWRAVFGQDPNAAGGLPYGASSTPVAPAVTLPADLPFRLIREAGRGGSAAVYEAEDRDLSRRVALKVYHRPDRDRAKLLHEARVAVAVAGDGIVPVLDVDPRRGWLAMLWAPLGALRPQSGMAWIYPLARALARVHAVGWVHHDLKPANVLLRAPDAPMLADFGSARRAGEPSPPGSLGYVSPERLGGRPSDPRDDVYAFGRVLLATLDTLSSADSGTEVGNAWRALAEACTGADARRPSDGAELSLRIEQLPLLSRRR